MDNKVRSGLLWGVAVVLVSGSFVYQRRTGPTWPVKGYVRVGNLDISFELPRSYDGAGDAEIRVAVPSLEIQGAIEFMRFRSNDPWSRQSLQHQGNGLVGRLPHQPPAGKVAYRIYLTNGSDTSVALTSEPVILRFRNPVPPWIWIPHVLGMFLTMLLSSRAGLEACIKGTRTYTFVLWTAIFLFVGGFILGPVMQKYAFNMFWTGWPIGSDLTDNKTAVALLAWVLAFWRIRVKRDSRGWVIAAALLTVVVYLIPHSMMGSELRYAQ